MSKYLCKERNFPPSTEVKVKVKKKKKKRYGSSNISFKGCSKGLYWEEKFVRGEKTVEGGN